MPMRSRQRGVSLIEVLVAIVVFSVGVLGLALMQIKGAQFTKQAGARSQVIVETRNLIDAMRANPVAAAGPRSAADPTAPTANECPYCLSGDAEPAASSCTSACTARQVAQNDLARWYARLKASVPGPTEGTLATVRWDNGLGMYRVTSRWAGGAMGDDAPTGNDDLSYTLNYLP
ncbi:type IV pilus modification protein PilV [Dyella sp. C9]|uniref:type IV pilus modification protein PilV n=1 Tax=Dyella sp. C9 TaxID=2202154 RepID=UPI000DEFD34A|nr:type IV pilus modification protein PilV [Dyella sp. C9]